MGKKNCSKRFSKKTCSKRISKKTSKRISKRQFGAIRAPSAYVPSVKQKKYTSLLFDINYSILLDFNDKDFIKNLVKDFIGFLPFQINELNAKISRTRNDKFLLTIKIVLKDIPVQQENEFVDTIPRSVVVNKSNFDFKFSLTGITIQEVDIFYSEFY